MLPTLPQLLLLALPAFQERVPAGLDPARGHALIPERCHALIIGVLEWKDPDFASFSKEERQDALLAQTLVERGIPPEQVTLLLDEQATLANIEAKLAEVAKAAGPDATLLFYYAGHGTRAGESGCFANYDMTGTDDGLRVERIAEIVEDHFEGERVLLFADCCHSGCLGSVVDRLGGDGFTAACVTSVVPESTSTGNWTFTQTLIEAFRGDPSLDADADGAIDRGELERAVSSAMAWRESQRSSAHSVGVGPEFTLAPVQGTPAAVRFREAARATTPALTLGDHVRDVESGNVARIVGRVDENHLLIRIYDYATHEDLERPVDQLEALKCEQVAVGSRVGVRQGPDRVEAEVVAVDGPFHRVVYPAWPEVSGEWMVASRLGAVPDGFDPSHACMVEWNGTWYRALTLSAEEREWRIHYVGYSDRWDEQVPPERIRFPAAAAAAPAATPDHR